MFTRYKSQHKNKSRERCQTENDKVASIDHVSGKYGGTFGGVDISKSHWIDVTWMEEASINIVALFGILFSRKFKWIELCFCIPFDSYRIFRKLQICLHWYKDVVNSLNHYNHLLISLSKDIKLHQVTNISSNWLVSVSY